MLVETKVLIDLLKAADLDHNGTTVFATLSGTTDLGFAEITVEPLENTNCPLLGLLSLRIKIEGMMVWGNTFSSIEAENPQCIEFFDIWVKGLRNAAKAHDDRVDNKVEAFNQKFRAK